MSHNEKELIGEEDRPTRTTSQADVNRDVTRSISKKLLDWGVEERGMYCMVLDRLDLATALIRKRLVCLPLDRYTPRRHRRENRNAFHQDIFRMAVCKYEHPVVCLPFLLNCASSNSGSYNLTFS